MTNSTLNSHELGGSQILTGQGGTGGQLNTGIVLNRSIFNVYNGSLSLTGLGGAGINIKESSGISLDKTILNGASIALLGTGGESTLKKNALDETSNDTFKQTADNIGVEIKDSSLTSTSGTLFITGSGGKLSVD